MTIIMLSLPKAILLSLTHFLYAAMTFYRHVTKNEMDFAASMLKTSRINSADY